ncbi:hypothetical protein OSTOST_11799 [Ostertagia ostertagi]
MFQPDAVTPLESDPAFSLSTPQDVHSLASTLSSFRALPFVNHSEAYWPEKFIGWSANSSAVTCLINCSATYSWITAYATRLRTFSPLIMTLHSSITIRSPSPGTLPFYQHTSRTLIAFISWHTLFHCYPLCRHLMDGGLLNGHSFPLVITCACIIACSVGCVTLLGWEIGVLEAVILVLVVGLSFDYTLHFGAALPKTGCKSHRIQRAAQLAAVPVSLSASTSFLAGASMLFSQTHAFSQVGVFLIVLTLCSWVFATFFFLPLLFFTLRSTKRCDDCDSSTVPSYPMDEKFRS